MGLVFLDFRFWFAFVLLCFDFVSAYLWLRFGVCVDVYFGIWLTCGALEFLV